jgi:outer membrane protein assembly factor BamB
MPASARTSASLIAIVFAWAICPSVWGQGRARLNATPDDSQVNKDAPVGVTIPDSPGATEKLDQAKRKQDDGQWKTAAEFYHDAITQFAGRVVVSKIDKSTGTFEYIGIAPEVQERIAGWKPEGLRVFDAAYDKTAADLLATAGPGDVGTVQTVFWEYFVTPAGKEAGIRLADIYLESGDYPAAAWVASRLLKLHPALAGDWGMVAYRAVVASHYAGDDATANAVLAQLKGKPNETGSLGGHDVHLADAADAVMTGPLPVAHADPSDADTWPSFGGIGGHGQLSTSTARAGASLNTINLQPPDFSGQINGARLNLEQSEKVSLANFQAMGVMPVADAGSLFFQDGRSLYAVDLDSGVPLPAWLVTYPGDRKGRYHVNVTGRARNEELTLTVTPQRVYAVMGQMDRNTVGNQYQNNGRFNNGIEQDNGDLSARLVCLDRNTGREQWVRTPSDLPEAAGTLRSGQYNGTPLVVPARFGGKAAADDAAQVPEDSLLVCVRGGRDNQFDDCYIVCLSARTGDYRWSTYVGSAMRSYDGTGGGSQDASQLALADGRVLFMSNLGTVGALDPADGRVVWLAGYTRDGSEGNMEAFQRRQFAQMNGEDQSNRAPAHPWARNPVIVSGGKVFAMPTDSRNLFVFDAETGVELKRLPMTGLDKTDVSPIQPDNSVVADVILGVRGEIVYVSSFKSVFALDWNAANPIHPQSAIRAQRENLAGYSSSIPEPQNNRLCGRGFLTADSLFISSKQQLYELDPDKMSIRSVYPAQGSFTNGQVPGNIIVTSQNVIVAGQERVDTYTDLKLVRVKFDRQIAAKPDDPEPHIRYADALFAGAQAADAMKQIDDAIAIVGGRGSMRPGPGRTLIYSSVLEFALRTGGFPAAGSTAKTQLSPPKLASDVAFTDKLFDRVIDAACTPVERATARLKRAEFDHALERFSDEVALCQDVLSDPEQREAMVKEDSTGGHEAEIAIGVVIARDSAIYDAVEGKAEAARARAGDDPEKLLAVADQYPNSKAAVAARQSAVVTFEARNEPGRAIEIQKKMYVSAAGDHGAQAALLTQIAGNYLTMPGGVGPAIDRLAWASRIYHVSEALIPSPLKLPNGSVLTKVKYADALAKLRDLQTAEASAKLPDFGIPRDPTGKLTDPFSPAPPPETGGVVSLVYPLAAYPCSNQLLAWSNSGLRIYPVGKTIPLAVIAAVNETPLAAARVGDKWIVWTSSMAIQFSAVTGSVDWTFKLASLPELPVTAGPVKIDPAGDDDANGNANQRAIQLQLQLQGRMNGVVVNGQLRMRGGMVRNIGGQPGPGMPVPSAIPNGTEQIASAQPAGGMLVVSTSTGRTFTIQLRNGTVGWQFRPSDKSVDQQTSNAAYTAVRFDDPAGSMVVVYETASGRVVGRRKFGQEGAPNQLINTALSEEGSLALTLAGKIEVKNLYDDWSLPPTDLSPNHFNRDGENFTGLSQADQLVASGGRVVALYAAGAWCRSYNLSYTDADSASKPLDTDGSANAVWLRVIGSKVFMLHASSWTYYDLNDNTGCKIGSRFEDFSEHARALFIGQTFVVVLNDPIDRGPAGSPNVQLLMYYRGPAGSTGPEDCLLSYLPKKISTSGPGALEWAGVDGGFYYLTADQKLHFLAVAPVKPPTTAPVKPPTTAPAE